MVGIAIAIIAAVAVATAARAFSSRLFLQDIFQSQQDPSVKHSSRQGHASRQSSHPGPQLP